MLQLGNFNVTNKCMSDKTIRENKILVKFLDLR